MAFYCFNADCNLWGEPQSVSYTLTYPLWTPFICAGCGLPTLVEHDNWEKDERRGDDNRVVADDCTCEVSLHRPHKRGECWYTTQHG